MTVSVKGSLYQFDLPAHGWATLSVKPATSINCTIQSKFTGGFKITYNGENYRIALPSNESGRVDLLTIAGQVVESKVIPQGCREFFLPKQIFSHAGLFIVRVVYGNKTQTARLFKEP
jgi:hypothetical protein